MLVKNIEIISISSGLLGEKYIKHELDLGIQRLKVLGINPSFSNNALKGIQYIKEHPEKRAKDLITAFNNDKIDMILCAIGGDDSYKLAPYLLSKKLT